MTPPADDRQLVTTYLHMTEPAQFQPAWVKLPGLRLSIRRMEQVDVAFYRFLYERVGEPWRWRDRRLMSDDALAATLSHPGCAVYVLYVDDEAAGYVELLRTGAEVEVVYLGLLPAYIGRGLGKHLLSYGVARAWETGAARVHVHTCNLDAPQAIDNYLKRGFRVYCVESEPLPARYAT